MIRQAKPTDAPLLSQLIILAMGDLANKFVNGKSLTEATALFTQFASQPGNQYSYENALVYKNETSICGMILGYNGADLNKLRAPFLQHIKAVYGFNQSLEDETQAGEYYIDCLSVLPGHQGKGIARQLIKALIEHAAGKGYTTTGLIVHKDNTRAKDLYINMRFEVVDEKIFVGDVYEHLQHS